MIINDDEQKGLMAIIGEIPVKYGVPLLEYINKSIAATKQVQQASKPIEPEQATGAEK